MNILDEILLNYFISQYKINLLEEFNNDRILTLLTPP